MSAPPRMKYLLRRITHELTNVVVQRVTLSRLCSLVNAKRIHEPFIFSGERLSYLFHTYNNMGLTERSVEIPIIKHYLTRAKWQRVLEVGNVTNYYEDYYLGLFPNKTVVDKFERNYNVVTCDIAQFSDADRFDFIFSISTFEHMDSDLGRNADYVPGMANHSTVAVDNIIHCYEKLLRPGGLMIVTAPLGYTPEWDTTFIGRALDDYGFQRLRRHLVSRVDEQRWTQREEIPGSEKYCYGHPHPFANHLSIIEISA